jgi:transposase-like protein
MSTKIDQTESVIAGGEPFEIPDAIRDRLSDEVIDQLLAGARTEEEIVGPGGVLAQLTKRLVERAMTAELSEHLGYAPHQEPPGGVGWGARFPVITQAWLNAWEYVTPFLAFPPSCAE